MQIIPYLLQICAIFKIISCADLEITVGPSGYASYASSDFGGSSVVSSERGSERGGAGGRERGISGCSVGAADGYESSVDLEPYMSQREGEFCIHLGEWKQLDDRMDDRSPNSPYQKKFPRCV